MSKSKVLIQLDSDPQPSVFDAVVAVDSGVNHLLRHGGVTVDQVQSLVHGAIFTRGPDDLHGTAVFVGGSQTTEAEKIAAAVRNTFFGPMRVSVMLDPNGCNTTAAAAVACAARHVALAESSVAVLAATGPVGERCVRLLASAGANVVAVSRSLERAEAVCRRIKDRCGNASVTAAEATDADSTAKVLAGQNLIIAAGAAGIELASEDVLAACKPAVAIDLNAVPPAGLGGISPTDRGAEKFGGVAYGAIGVGATKMRIHRAALAALFQSADRFLDAEEIYALAADVAA